MTVSVRINGFPKSGNHALMKALHLIGVDCAVEHLPFAHQFAGEPRILVKRDPRNIIVSWLRWSKQEVAPGTFIVGLGNFMEEGPLVDRLAEYEGWLADPAALQVKYEDLIASPEVMMALAEWCGVPYLDGAWEKLPGKTLTWMPKHSDWRAIWLPEVEAAWVAAGGPALLERWGYV